MKKLVLLSILSFLFLGIIGCQKSYTKEEKQYIAIIEKERAEKDKWMEESEYSPFNYKKKIEFHPLKYYDVDPEFIFKTKLYEFPKKDSLTIFGTKGEARPTIRFGYIKIYYGGKYYKINVYQSKSRQTDASGNPITYYSIWFTDRTTNNETYGVGRYLDFERVEDKNFIYIVDFNKAYNPYCAYSAEYSCAIPTKEDFIDLAIEAGEKKYHE